MIDKTTASVQINWDNKRQELFELLKEEGFTSSYEHYTEYYSPNSVVKECGKLLTVTVSVNNGIVQVIKDPHGSANREFFSRWKVGLNKPEETAAAIVRSVASTLKFLR